MKIEVWVDGGGRYGGGRLGEEGVQGKSEKDCRGWEVCPVCDPSEIHSRSVINNGLPKLNWLSFYSLIFIVLYDWGTRAMRRRQFYSANGFVSENRATRAVFGKIAAEGFPIYFTSREVNEAQFTNSHHSLAIACSKDPFTTLRCKHGTRKLSLTKYMGYSTVEQHNSLTESLPHSYIRNYAVKMKMQIQEDSQRKIKSRIIGALDETFKARIILNVEAVELDATGPRKGIRLEKVFDLVIVHVDG
ncbi:hypothetical protein LXL04_037553 [Taraxacum kok-saghyz]